SAIVTWFDYRSGTNHDIYAQHVLASGAVDPAWPADGRALCTAANDQLAPTIVPDGSGGAIVTWYDLRDGASYDIYAQHVLASGAVDPAWPADGRALCTAASSQMDPTIVSDGSGGTIVTWSDNRSGNWDIYAQRLARFGYLGTPEAPISGVRDVPNDQGGKVKVSWSASYLDLQADPNLAAYDVYRSVPPNVALAAIARGALRLSRLGETPAPHVRAFYIGPAGTTGYAWEYVATQVAAHAFANYSYVASTTSDSLPGSNPKTAFVILARNSSGSMFWLSAADSGYSVDNLAPVAPSPFTGQYAAGSTTLRWSRNTEADLAGYRVYRGQSPSFVPGPGNLVAALRSTGYVDAAGGPAYYKLSAVDTHGNESPYAFLLPGGTVGVDDAALAIQISFARPAPNPARDEVAFRFALPREARVELAIFDAAGRRVRTLVAGVRAGGEHAPRWDLSDEAGRSVGAGLYFARLEAEGQRLVRRLAVTR
ncbi:MAG: hypothetical protein HZC42_12735, partial [Candidatus Eisenbacteria bacterium]|nr:hypothetical protein [Candidatus Eisenbacteria bacterium]